MGTEKLRETWTDLWRERGLGTNRDEERHWGIEKKDEEKQDLEIDFETPDESSQNLLAARDQYM